MKFSRKLVSLMLAAMMVMAMSLTAFAATNVKMYGYMNGKYVESSHTAVFIEDAHPNADGTYTINFQPATVYGSEGYLSSMTVNGETFGADDDGYMEVKFTYQPTVEVADGVYGQYIEYTVNVSGTTHPTNTGALVIQ